MTYKQNTFDLIPIFAVHEAISDLNSIQAQNFLIMEKIDGWEFVETGRAFGKCCTDS